MTTLAPQKMNIEHEIGKAVTLRELQEFLEQHGMAVSLARLSLTDRWLHTCSLSVVRVAGKLECTGMGDTIYEALVDAASNMDKLLTLGR